MSNAVIIILTGGGIRNINKTVSVICEFYYVIT